MRNYSADSIQHLSFREGCRMRVGIYLGSANQRGMKNGLLELVNNATDEALACETANRIIIEIGKDWASCQDFGRGIPVGKNKYTNEVLINLLTENHSGGKFDENAYGGKSRGLNGTGSAATCCSSDWFEVYSYRDGYEWFLRFEKGIPCAPTAKKVKPSTNTGTLIKFSPSSDVFGGDMVHFDYKDICDTMKEYSYFNKGITFIVKNAETGEENQYLSKNGMLDFAKDHIKTPLHHTPIYYNTTENDIDIEIIAQWTSDTRNEQYYLFSNGGENPDGGTPITGARMGITRTINNLTKKNFSGDMIRTGLVYIISIQLKDPQYEGQVKNRITNSCLQGMCQSAFSKAIKTFSEEYPTEFKIIIDKLSKEEKAEAAAERARTKILEANKEMMAEGKKKGMLAGKLVDCRNHGPESMLIIVEGDGALESVAGARDSENIAAIPLDGKIINALKNPVEKVLDSDRVKRIITALGCGVGDSFNIKKLRYGKIGIMADADPDGFSIMCLVLALVYKYMPELIIQEKVHWVITPLYRSETKSGKFYYAYSDEEMENLPKGELTRFKGLGELLQEDLENTTFKNGKVNSIIFTMNHAEEASKMFEMLMGEEVAPRRDYIFENVDFERVEE